MVRRFDGFDFWERRCKALELSQTPATKSDIDSEPSLSFETESPKFHSEPTSPVLSQIIWPTIAKPLGSATPTEPIVIRTVSAVHDVRNSMSFSPSLDQNSQSACVLRPGSYEEKEEFLTVIKREGSRTNRDGIIGARRVQSGPSNTRPKRRSPLKLETTNLSGVSRPQQRYSTMPDLPPPSSNISPLDHRHTLGASADCNKCISRETDKAFEALTNALRDKRQDETKHITIIRPSIDCRMPSLKSPKPVRPKVLDGKLLVKPNESNDADSNLTRRDGLEYVGYTSNGM
ncbi:hypothetical protein FBEOM_11173 [Fusarium beomiforme]|uniref:Uncharacterized protein n=1 Tax=Fusarium beomiforme TaxID=44412 RepID=A0A9P5DRY5_9HYPO|nr:hypothetical protein FBEOM_11173 [Fusarium beomiforme]